MRKLLVLETYVKAQDGLLHQKKALVAKLFVCADALRACILEKKA